MKTTRWVVLGLWLVVGMMMAVEGWPPGTMPAEDAGSLIDTAVYDEEKATLVVVFWDGNVVMFRDVRPGQFEELMRMEDRAGYLYREVLAGCELEFVAR